MLRNDCDGLLARNAWVRRDHRVREGDIAVTSWLSWTTDEWFDFFAQCPCRRIWARPDTLFARQAPLKKARCVPL